MYFFNGLNTDADIIIVILLAVLLFQTVISIVFIIMGFTCWKGRFYEEIFKSFSRRFFYFADLILSHIVIIVFGLMIIGIYQYSKFLNILNYIIFTFSVFQSIFSIIIIIGILLSCISQSDAEFLDNSEINNSSQNFFYNPQKMMMKYSLIVLLVFTFIDFIISIILYSNYVDRSMSIEFIDIYLGGCVILFSLILFIISKIYYNGNFLNKLTENKKLRLSILIFGFIFYISFIIIQIFHYKFVMSIKDYRKGKLFGFNSKMTLACPLIETVSLIVFINGFCIDNKSKKIYDPASLINSGNINQ